LANERGAGAALLLEDCARLLDRRWAIADRARALSAQARASAWIVAASPFVLFASFAAGMPEFVRPFWTTSRGREWLAGVVLLSITGLFVCRRIVQRETRV
jgi:tight adherence protein B